MSCQLHLKIVYFATLKIITDTYLFSRSKYKKKNKNTRNALIPYQPSIVKANSIDILFNVYI